MDESELSASRTAELGDLAERILRVARRLDAYRFRDPGITQVSPVEAMLLRYIDDYPGTSPGAMARALLMRGSNVSSGLRSLEGKGLVRREADKADARVVHLFATDLAQVSVHKVRAEWGRMLAGQLPSDVDVTGLQRILATLDHAPNNS